MAIAILKYMKMKNIVMYLSIIVLLASCESSSEVEFPDFTYQTIYFPVQNPVRTIVLGDEIRFDSSIDLEKAFSIGVNVGGLYENTKDRKVSIKLAPELVPTDPTKLLITTTNDTLVLLPPSYYKASSLTEMVIPKGSFVGKIRVDLTDAFFNDPKSVNVKYVLPLLINPDPTSKDSVLQGKPAVANPIRTKRSDWLGGLTPKDYTLFAVNYTNKNHGVYFLYGADQVYNAAGVLVSTKPYRKPVVTDNITTPLTTLSLSECLLGVLGGTNTGASYKMKLKYNDDKTITLGSVKGAFPVTGSGIYKDPAEGVVWSQQGHKTVILNYSFKDASNQEHRCKDTLVYRSSGIVYKEFVLK
jgi:Domain of unknown function (DUF1735)/Family of unknown function (DUF5627)